MYIISKFYVFFINKKRAFRSENWENTISSVRPSAKVCTFL